jgi:isopentenyl phosphate kinase
MIGDELLKKVGDLGDAEINLLLMHVEGLLETDEEKNRAQELLERIQHTIQG